jgi:hypothetical protein
MALRSAWMLHVAGVLQRTRGFNAASSLFTLRDIHEYCRSMQHGYRPHNVANEIASDTGAVPRLVIQHAVELPLRLVELASRRIEPLRSQQRYHAAM